jgi:molybdopterin adenylyltransferase
MSTKEHRKNAPEKLRISVLTISTTRTLENDQSGLWIKNQAVIRGHDVILHQVIPDEAKSISQMVLHVLSGLKPHVLLLTGGTGISSKDVTIEAVRPLFEKELTGFGSIFAQLSFQEINSAAILSRATAGVIDRTIIFCMPGSLKACILACNSLIFPELGHLVKHAHE